MADTAAPHLPLDPATVKGFLDPEEGRALYQAAATAPGAAPCLEVGSYCGRSTVWLGAGCAQRHAILFALDHHRGSEEHQPGEAYHDPEVATADGCAVDTFPLLRATLEQAGLTNTVVPIVAPSAVVARAWATPLALVFIDGGHSMEAALVDYRAWIPHLMPGGILAIHDIFPNPVDGGRAPYEIWRLALGSGLLEEVAMVKTLGLAQRIG